MTALFRLAAFEARYQLRRVSAWVYFFCFAAIAFFMTAAAAGAWPEMDMGSPILRANSPLRIASTLLGLAVLGVPITAAIAGNAVYRDFQTGIFPLFFTTPIRKAAYLGGRWLGAVAANFVVFLGAPLGIWLATVSPWPEAGRIAPFSAASYLLPLAVLILPNLLFTAAVFLTLAAVTRRMLPNYVGGMVLLLGWALARVFIDVLDRDWAVWMLDPFGSAAVQRITRYWTVVDQNVAPLPLPPMLLANRALWLGLGAAVFAAGAAAFRFQHAAPEARRRRPADEPGPALARPAVEVPRVRREFGLGMHLRQLAGETRRAIREVVANPWFPAILGICLAFVMISATQVGSLFGTTTYPVTYQVLEMLTGTFALFVVIVVTFYSGELVWNERELRAAGIHDSLPVPTWVPLAAKIAALFAVVVAMMAAAFACGILIQSARGYFRFEPGLYLRELFVVQLLGNYVPIVFLSVLVQTLVNHKYVGHFLVILFYVGSGVLALLGLEHNLTVYGSVPQPVYSDMNGYGHGLVPWGWYSLFWGLVALLLAVASNLFRVRGEEGGWRARLRLARHRLTRPLLAATGGIVLLAVATGGWIVYNTTVLNDFDTRREGERVQAEYEKDYKRYEWVPQPRVTAANLQVDLFPDRRDARLRGVYTLVNRTASRIDSIHVDYPNNLEVRGYSFDRPFSRVVDDRAKGYQIFRLGRPLMPGDSARMTFDLEMDSRGFEDSPDYGPVVGNGTFMNSQLIPQIGYNPEGELMDEGARERYGLPPRPRAASIHDPRARTRNFVSPDADWIAFEVTVSTSADQTAVAPGYLQREWRQGGRRFFRYRMDAPMLNFYAFLSARYNVRRDRWRDVAVEVYHHPGHEYNVGRMIESVKASLDYYTREFGPYQSRQVRILEFPRYGQFAQSFDNTIPYSEGIGFIADVGRDDIDYPFFVTAHEVAHQWWGHQLAPADVQGAATLSETLAEYSALMVMEKRYGREQIGRFLRHELDAYLRGRGTERRAEKPLVLVENQQYIHYNKGALAMYALRDLIGEARVNGALRALLAETRYQGPPYPTALDLVRHLRAATPDSLRGAVADLFEHVTLWETKAAGATYRRRADGKYDVEVTVETRKIRADSLGNETDLPVDDRIDIGVYAAGRNEPIYLRKHRITSSPQTVRVTVDRVPRRAGIDPLHKLIDRKLDDNVVSARPAPRSTSPARRPANRTTGGDSAGRTRDEAK